MTHRKGGPVHIRDCLAEFFAGLDGPEGVHAPPDRPQTRTIPRATGPTGLNRSAAIRRAKIVERRKTL